MVRRVSLSSASWAMLLAAVVGWAGLVLAAPVLGRADAGGQPGSVLAAGAYVTGALVCHQRPERSFHLAGAQLPVCGRCTGFYLSAAAGVLIGVIVGGRRTSRSRPRTRAPAPVRLYLLAAVAPSALTFGMEWSGAWAVSNAARAAAAAPVGLVVGVLLVEAAGFRGRL